MAEVGSFGSRPHAEMAAGMLDAHGIPATVMGDDAGGAAPHVAFGAHGYRLRVADADADEARALLAADASGPDEADGPAVLLSDGIMRTVGAVIVVLVVLAVVIGIVS